MKIKVNQIWAGLPWSQDSHLIIVTSVEDNIIGYNEPELNGEFTTITSEELLSDYCFTDCVAL